MDSIMVFIYAEREELHETSTLRVSRRILRNTSMPLDLPSTEFQKLFRLSKEAFVFVLEEIKNEFKSHNSNGIPTILKLAATLRFLAEGSYQKGVGQDTILGMAQPTVSIIMSKTLEILERKLCPKLISFKMTAQEKQEAKTSFYEKTGFPGVIMCIDGTHISIIRPTVNEHHFYNGKGYHSINAMMSCDHKMRITCVNARYGGSSHDSVVWSMSRERSFIEEQFKNGDSSKILGDAGYALEPWMMTPYRSPASGSTEAKFNTVHSRCRNIIERCFGLMKTRFRCLLHSRELHYHPEKAARIINVCAMLHNVCLKFNVPLNEHQTAATHALTDDANDLSNVSFRPGTNYLNIAKQIRDEIKNSL